MSCKLNMTLFRLVVGPNKQNVSRENLHNSQVYSSIKNSYNIGSITGCLSSGRHFMFFKKKCGSQEGIGVS